MASTYSTNLKLELIASGEQSGTWGNSTNNNVGTLIEQSIVGSGSVVFTADADMSVSISDGATSGRPREAGTTRMDCIPCSSPVGV